MEAPVLLEEDGVRLLQKEDTFYNPAQQLNRSLSLSVAMEHAEGKESVRILDAMSATGLRGLMYSRAIPNATVYINDISESALESIRENIVLNEIGEDRVRWISGDLRSLRSTDGESRMYVTHADCNVLMSSLPGFFDIIDLDPFGCCSEYIDAAMRAVKHGGLLCVTATDKGVLCSNEQKCQIKYSTAIMKRFAMNETALRTVLSLLSRQASKFGASIEPLLSVSIDFYVRVFIKVSKRSARSVIRDNSMALLCECLNMLVLDGRMPFSSVCSNCSRSMKLCGPFWNAGMSNVELVRKIMGKTPDTEERKLGLLRLLEQETASMFYYELPKVASLLKVEVITIKNLITALFNLGYPASLTHCEPNAIKTTAPIDIINKVFLLNHKPELEIPGVTADLFRENTYATSLLSTRYFRGKLRSGLGPLALPRKK
jgi:tRNA (guanine26-N2/guanine27-N2)-dimethyltransferase